MITRQEKILSAIDPATQSGIEIGPLNRPIVTRQMGKIHYVDYATTEELKLKYASEPSVDIDQIVEVDDIWGEKRLPELVGNKAPFDYVIASHVIEHVPDLVGWLKEIHAVLKPGGVLALAIPDKRYCFDFLRQPTEPAQVIEAYLLGNRKPTPGQVFEFHSRFVLWQEQIGWSHEVERSELVRLHTDQQAFELAHQASIDNGYYDVHCWVFTPRTFFQLLRTLIDIGLVDFKVTQYYESVGCEFFVNLEAMDLTKNPDDRKAIQLESLPIIDRDYPQIPQPEPETDPMRSLLAELETERAMRQQAQNQIQAQLQGIVTELKADRDRATQAQLREHQETIQRLRKRVNNLKSRLENSENEIAAMKTSKFWQVRSRWVNLKTKLLGQS